MQRFGIEEHQIMKAVLREQESGENGIRQEVDKIAAWISNESRRNRSNCGQSVVNAEKNSEKLPAPKIRWHLGVRSSSDPVDIMLDIYAALKDMGFEWHSSSPYQLTIRPKMGDNKVINLIKIKYHEIFHQYNLI